MIDEEDPPDPLVTREIERALSIYRGLLPEKVLETFGIVLDGVLRDHPVCIGLVARLKPSIRVDVDMPSDERARGFQGFALIPVLRAVFKRIAARLREEGGAEFVFSDRSLIVLNAFLCYFPYDETIMQLSDEVALDTLGMICDSSVGAMFLGTMQEIRSRTSLKEWGETGRELLEVRPRAQAILGRALSSIPAVERAFIERYGTCDWDEKRVMKRLRVSESDVRSASLISMRMLGIALRGELEKKNI